MITAHCTSCPHTYTVSDDLSGRFVYCPQCGSELTILRGPGSSSPIDVNALSHWHVRRGDAEHGPHPFEKLQLAVARGFLDPGDLIRREGDHRWVKAESITGLFDVDADELSSACEEESIR
ncbi:MAG: GYF domain-containing protein [Planctomycetota bacterium]|nr:GYF domain-containing protein [Planctomycetota bacterium]MDA1214208.1 GYF domain-containing protein [Planctomycetota bacterium]